MGERVFFLVLCSSVRVYAWCIAARPRPSLYTELLLLQLMQGCWLYVLQAEKQRVELQRELELLAERLQEAGGVSQAQVTIATRTISHPGLPAHRCIL